MVALLISHGLEAIDNPRIALGGAARAVLYRMLQSEYAGVTSRHVDLDPALHQVEAQAAIIARELASAAREVEVCYRGDVRRAAVLDDVALAAGAAPAFAGHDTVLITGGTRGLGMLCARHLVAHHGVRRLVLAGRDALPPRDAWAQPQPPAIAAKLAAIAALEALGAEVHVAQLALEVPAELRRQLAVLAARLGPIVGLLHCAGLTDHANPAFVRKPLADIARVLAPKVTGTPALLAALDPAALRHVVLFSSVAAIVPGLGAGQSDYAMANGFLDYCAQAHAGALPITSVQWPSWRDTGLGEVTAAAYVQTGMRSISDAEGLALLDRVLAARPAVVMPLIVDPARFDAARLLAPPAPAPKVAGLPPAIPEPTPGAESVQLVAFLAQVFEAELKLAPGQLDPATPYADYGADSILLAQILQKIRLRLGVALGPATLLEYPTVTELAAWLLAQFPAAIAAQLRALAPAVIGPPPTTMPAAVSRAADPSAAALSVAVPVAAPSAAVASAAPSAAVAIAGPAAAVPAAGPSAPVPVAAPSAAVPVAGPSAAVAIAGPAAAAPLAVVGMACRLPGAPDLAAYWRLLSEGRTAIRPVPADCWGVATEFHAGLIDDVYGFDPAHFLISLDDARAMDPQALVVLEECVMAVSHAGYPAAELGGTRTGVYIGGRGRSHAGGALIADARNPIMAVGQNYLAANVARALDLQGPALVVDTACSSALVALALASDALATGAIDAALVAGVSLLTSPADHELFARRGLLAAGGAHHIFDRRAAGVVPGEGAGVVMVKRLADAERDGDTVYAVIHGVAINNDGRTAGPATPSLQAQKQVMRAALARAAVAPADVSYLDVNGSGSEVTDLLELKAVEAVYRPARGAPLALGSMKPNIGHPLCAEAIASLIKVALMVHHQRVVPMRSGDQPPEHYDLAAAGLVLPRQTEPAALGFAALSSFADGGTNGHVVLGHHAAAGRRTPIAPPVLTRVDVRTGEPIARPAGAVLDHGFARSPVWSTRLTAAHPILDHHRVYGQRLLPGLAWIDLLYQWLAERSLPFDQIALRQLAIYRPLTVAPDASLDLVIEARPHGERWAVEVRDRAAGDDAQPYITAELHRQARAAFDERVPVAELEALARRPGGVDFEDLYRGYRAQELVHSGLVKATGRLFAGDGRDARWMYLALDERAAASAADFVFHPTLIDASAVGAGAATASLVGDEPRLYLPLYYEAFHASAPIQRACYARIRQSSIERQAELVTVTLEYFDLAGHKVAELARYTTKLVRHAGLINPARAAQAPAIAVPVAAASPIAAPAGGIGALVIAELARHTGLPATAITPGLGFYQLGLDSPRLLAVVKTIEQAIAARLSPTLLFEHTTVGAVIAHLEATYGGAASSPSSPSSLPSSSASLPPPARRAPTARAAARTTHLPLGATLATPASAPAAPAAPAAIAIIGLAGRYPEADSIDELWANLVAARDSIIEVPEDRWPASELADVRSPSGRAMSRWGGFVRDADCFDARFFGIAPAEAALLDPQERLFLETSWQAIEDAGYTPASLVAPDGGRRVGVYVGVMHKDYTLVQDAAVARGERFPLTLNYAPIANRVSHACDFQGPSMAIDTVCASSLTAVHLAVDSLRRGECEVAIAGGVNLSLHPDKYQTYGLLDMHASDGRCRSFGAGGDGYVSAEGVGAVVLKPLARALADGDGIYAVIRASAVNHAGRTAGLSVPSPAAQAQLVTDCLAQAGIDPASITCIEAHGTGTPLGDLIELKGLIRAFRAGTDRQQFCALGSIKSNIGHAEAAAGISSLTKATLQLHHRQLVGLLHADPPNPYLELAGSPFYLQTELADWRLDPAAGVELRRAGVSAFGATGSNAHVIVEEAPTVAPAPRAASPARVLVPLSANTEDRLRAYAGKLAGYLAEHPEADLVALGYTLQVGRVALEDRAIVAVRDIVELEELMGALARGEDDARLWRGRLAGLAARPTLLDDPALLRDLARRWSDTGAWRKLAELWLTGYAVDWRALYDDAPGRLHLPSYPFARDRHWISSVAAPAPVAAPPAPVPITGGAPDAVSYLRRLVATQLGRPADAIPVDAGFLELGLSSLGLVGLSQRIARDLDPAFSPGQLFDHATIAELAAHLAPRHAAAADRLAAPSQTEPPDADVLDALEQLARGALSLDAALARVN
ncbi:MAG TPA: beta-ketoacyl synthase N-terminal-like domain-containing protein [Kofleriaceae bacterium]